MENKIVNTCLKGYFIIVAVLMYFFISQDINVGLFITYRHAFALVLFASAFVCFLFTHKNSRFIFTSHFSYCSYVVSDDSF